MSLGLQQLREGGDERKFGLKRKVEIDRHAQLIMRQHIFCLIVLRGMYYWQFTLT